MNHNFVCANACAGTHAHTCMHVRHTYTHIHACKKGVWYYSFSVNLQVCMSRNFLLVCDCIEHMHTHTYMHIRRMCGAIACEFTSLREPQIVYVSACVFVCVCVCVCVCVHAHANVCMTVSFMLILGLLECTAHIDVCIHACMYVCSFPRNACIMHACMKQHVSMHVSMHTCI
jgi:hypothetical protein